MKSRTYAHRLIDSWICKKYVFIVACILIASLLATFAIEPVQAVLHRLVDTTGHYALVMMGIVVSIRLILLPLTLKAERDKRIRSSLSGRVADIKDELVEQPDAISEATLQLYKRYKIRPIVNTLALAFQASLLLLFYSAIKNSAFEWSHEYVWFDADPARDPHMIMPMLAVGLFLAIVVTQYSLHTLQAFLLYAALAAVSLWILSYKSADTSLYLSAGMLLLLVQNTLFKRITKALNLGGAQSEKHHKVKDTGLVNLAHAHRLPQSTGMQAARLGQLIEAGYNVPEGFVFTRSITERLHQTCSYEKPLLSKRETKILNKLWRSLHTSHAWARASNDELKNSDSPLSDIHPSIADIHKDQLDSAIRQLHQTNKNDLCGVIIQKNINAQYTGVMFTEHPNTTGSMLVEWVETSWNTSSVKKPVTACAIVGKLSGNPIYSPSSDTAPIDLDLKPLLALGRELEDFFDRPQNIQWAYAKGEFYVLHTHDITRLVTGNDTLTAIAEQERNKLLQNLLRQRRRIRNSDQINPKKSLYAKEEHTVMPKRPTPLSADLINRLYSYGGSMDRACTEMSVDYNVHLRSMDYISTLFGWAYINKHEEHQRRSYKTSARHMTKIASDFSGAHTHFHEQFLPSFKQQMIERNAIAMERLTLEAATDIFQLWIQRFVEQTHCEVQRISIAAEHNLASSVALLKKAKLDPALYFSNIKGCSLTWPVSLLETDSSNDAIETADIKEFMLSFGHRATCDYELAEPRFAENQPLARQILASHVESEQSPERLGLLPYARKVKHSVQNTREFIKLKDEAEHYCLIELAQIRRLLLAIDEKLQLNGRVFQLRIDEVVKLSEPSERDRLLQLADERFNRTLDWQPLQLPDTLSIHDLEGLDLLTGAVPEASDKEDGSGTLVSGKSDVVGRVRVCKSADDISRLESGEILVAENILAAWHSGILNASGIITEAGGWLSDASIIARHHDLPSMVGVNNACQRFRNGDVIRICMSGSIDRVNERRGARTALRTLNTANAVFAAQSGTPETKEADIYQLTNRKLFRYSQRMDRRAMKLGASDRREQPRYDENGELEVDRRVMNRSEDSGVEDTDRWQKAG